MGLITTQHNAVFFGSEKPKWHLQNIRYKSKKWSLGDKRSLLVARFASEQRSKLKYLGRQHKFLANDFIRLMRLFAMCKHDPDT